MPLMQTVPPKMWWITAEDTPAGIGVTRVTREVFCRATLILQGFFQSHLRDMMSTELRCWEDFGSAGKHRQQISLSKKWKVTTLVIQCFFAAE